MKTFEIAFIYKNAETIVNPDEETILYSVEVASLWDAYVEMLNLEKNVVKENLNRIEICRK